MRSLVVSTVCLAAVLHGADSRIQALDESGAPFPDVLVIVRSLDGAGEVGRFLTDKGGRIPVLHFGDGLYRLVLTCPYGICSTRVVELFGKQMPSELPLTVPVKSTDEHGTLADQPTVQILIVSRDLKPLSKTSVLVRNLDATREAWYTTDGLGGVKIALPSVPVMVMIVRADTVYPYRFLGRCGRKGDIDEGPIECVDSGAGSVTFKLKGE